MSNFPNAQGVLVQGAMTATQVDGNVYNSPAEVTVSVANTQNNYHEHEAPLRGELWDLLYPFF